MVPHSLLLDFLNLHAAGSGTQTFKDVGYRCVQKRGLGGTCSSSVACKSGRCIGGFCSECPKIDSKKGCGRDKFCTQLIDAIGYRYGSVQQRHSLLVKRSSDDYLNNPMLSCRCKEKLGLGGACLSSAVCKSGYCVGKTISACFMIAALRLALTIFAFITQGGFCSQCPKIDSLEGCTSNKFCTLR